MLQMESQGGKTGRERTTGLAVFLALDKMQKMTSEDVINLHPDSEQRTHFTNAFVELLLIGQRNEVEYQASDLGFVELGDQTLAKKLSSNFLTVPLKRGSRQAEVYPYPGRPAPLLSLGTEISGYGKWGVTKHSQWVDNFVRFLEGRRCESDTFPLIVFLLREKQLSAASSAHPQDALFSALNTLFTAELSEYLVTHAQIPDEWGSHDFFTESYVSIIDNLDSRLIKEQSSESDAGNNLAFTFDYDNSEGDINFDQGLIRRIIAALKSGSHVILTGPPGTGKTTIATFLASRIKGHANYETFTATSNWTAFEVLGGYLPDPSNPQTLQFEAGFITKCVRENKWVIIDEINRADVDKAFGELFTVLTGKPVYLPYYTFGQDEAGLLHKKRVVIVPSSMTHLISEETEQYVVNDDWRIIGTMNTFDKSSLYQMSYAFMRRFAFIEVDPPSPEEMNLLLDEKIGAMNVPESIKSEILICLKNMFSSGLNSIGLGVGAAIPLNIIKYLEERIQLETDPDYIAEQLKKFILEAFFMYFFPQFEGRRRLHEDIVSVIVSSLNITKQEEKDLLDKELSSWTGNSIG